MWIVVGEEKRRERKLMLSRCCIGSVLRILWTARVTMASVVEQISPSSLEALVAKQKLSYFDHVMRRKDGMEKETMLDMRAIPKSGIDERRQDMTLLGLSEIQESMSDWKERSDGWSGGS